MIGNEIKGYRRTAFKSRHDNLTQEKVADFEARGEKVKVVRVGMYNLIYIKTEKQIEGISKTKKVADEKTSVPDVRKTRTRKTEAPKAGD